jgi:sortase A
MQNMGTKPRRRRTGPGTAFMALGGLLVLSAVLLFLHNVSEDMRASEAALRIADALTARIEDGAAPADGGEAESDSAETIALDGERYIGVLRIPALDLALPVMRDWSYEKLKISPCRYSGDIADDTMVIAAHNYRRHFGKIHTLPEGSELRFTGVDGSTIRYAIAKTEKLEATDIEGMSESAYDLTLFTCTYGGVARLAVRCNRSL